MASGTFALFLLSVFYNLSTEMERGTIERLGQQFVNPGDHVGSVRFCDAHQPVQTKLTTHSAFIYYLT